MLIPRVGPDLQSMKCATVGCIERSLTREDGRDLPTMKCGTAVFTGPAVIQMDQVGWQITSYAKHPNAGYP